MPVHGKLQTPPNPTELREPDFTVVDVEIVRSPVGKVDHTFITEASCEDTNRFTNFILTNRFDSILGVHAMYLNIALVWFIYSLYSVKLPTQPPAGVSAIIIEDQLFVAYPKPSPKNQTYGSELLRASIDDKDARSRWGSSSRMPYAIYPQDSVREGICKISIARDTLWYVAPGSPNFHAVPFSDLPYYEGSEWARKRAEEQLGKRAKDFSHSHLYWVNQLFDSAIQGVNIHQLLKDSPLKGFNGVPLNFMDYDSMLIRNTFYDLIPTGTNLFTLVHLTAGMIHMPKDMLVIQEMKLGTPHRDKRNEWIKPLPDSKPFIVKAPFEGDFWAYEVGGVYYLLTRKGKLYAVKKNKESVATSTIWQDEKKYLIGAIQDVAKGTVYAFGVDGKDGERFAFEFGLEPKVTKYKTEAKVGDGFKESQDCVRAMKPAAQKK